MNPGVACPQCRKKECHWLATTNEWKYYCPHCDIRFNERGEVLNGTS